MNSSGTSDWAAAWTVSPWLVTLLSLPTLIYVLGWWRLRRRLEAAADANSALSQPPRMATNAQLGCFLGAILTLAVALMSPLDSLAPLLLQVHMVQHVLLLFVVAPLLWLSAPLLPMVAGLPQSWRRDWAIPLLQWPALRNFVGFLAQPPIAWIVMVGTLWFWHAPPMYQLALENRLWHELEHAMFLTAAIIFWWPVLEPYPRRHTSARWKLIPYLFLAGIQGTILSGILAFSDRVLYPHYAAVPRLWGITPLVDQAMAGAMMWVPGSIALLIPLVLVVFEVVNGNLSSTRSVPATSRSAGTIRRTAIRHPASRRFELPVLTPEPAPPNQIERKWDLLRIPLFGKLLASRTVRMTLRWSMFTLAAAIVVDGLFGPSITPWNLAGVLPWIHWRGILVLALLVAGNFFCMACPFLVPRMLARKVLPASWRWPRVLRSKWTAVGLLVAFFAAYEAWSLWDSPWWTAWIVLGYFLIATVIDGLFQGASFCKYVCPIGQFNFVQSLWSPTEVQVRDAGICADCETKDCLRGNEQQNGCELYLFLPRKSGNLDCTFCLDCADACPHGNVGIFPVSRTSALVADEHRSGVGRLSQRPDFGVLVLILVAAAFVNAAWMIAPVVSWETRLLASLGSVSRPTFVVLGTLLGLLIVPGLVVGLASWISAKTARSGKSWSSVALRYIPSLIPLGLGMWTAHFGFHLFTSYDTLLPAAMRFVQESFGGTSAALPVACSCCATTADWIVPLEILLLDLGLCGSLLVAYRTSQRDFQNLRSALAAFFPWAVLIVSLFVLGVWIVLEPMQMRGTMFES